MFFLILKTLFKFLILISLLLDLFSQCFLKGIKFCTNPFFYILVSLCFLRKKLFLKIKLYLINLAFKVFLQKIQFLIQFRTFGKYLSSILSIFFHEITYFKSFKSLYSHFEFIILLRTDVFHFLLSKKVTLGNLMN